MHGTEFWRRLAEAGGADAPPAVATVLRDYFAKEKAVPFDGRLVVNTHFPPWPSRAFDRVVRRFGDGGEAHGSRLYSVTLGITNRCPFECWHCYNAGRSQRDVSFPALRRLAADLGGLGAVMVTLTGGEPLLRDDLPEIVSLFDDRFCTSLGTTGQGLTRDLAERLRARGLFGVGVSLDSADPAEHDRLRGRAGAFDSAVTAVRVAAAAGLYPYVVSVGMREFLARDRFLPFLAFAGSIGAREVHVLEPFASGRLAGRPDVLLTPAERATIVGYQEEVAEREDLPILSSFAWIEAPETFGCGAGRTHLYLDGAGEVYPCQQVPVSFGSVEREPLAEILARLGRRFARPRADCAAHLFAGVPVTTDPVRSDLICADRLPILHDLPRFARAASGPAPGTGPAEIRTAYEEVGEVYDGAWLTEAGAPVRELVARLPLKSCRRTFEAGCGTGYATDLLLAGLPEGADLLAVDLAESMLAVARRRVPSGARFERGDALAMLREERGLDLVFTSWVLGYVPLAPFFAAARAALAPGGLLAFVVHRLDSPREPMEIFRGLVAAEPASLLRRVSFDFPRDVAHAEAELVAAGLDPEWTGEGAAVFRFPDAAGALRHLLESGAGTTYANAVAADRRPVLLQRFREELAARHAGAADVPVVHDWVAAVARRPR